MQGIAIIDIIRRSIPRLNQADCALDFTGLGLKIEVVPYRVNEVAKNRD